MSPSKIEAACLQRPIAICLTSGGNLLHRRPDIGWSGYKYFVMIVDDKSRHMRAILARTKAEASQACIECD